MKMLKPNSPPPQDRMKKRITNPKVCSVYFIRGGGFIKIGCSTNLVARFRAIRNTSPVPVELVGKFPGGTLEEALLHDRFAADRVHGEWFKESPELLDVIARSPL
jgi:hypothetical protein